MQSISFDDLLRLAGRISDAMPSQTLLFRLGHAREVLDGFAGIADTEWPDFSQLAFEN
jgi:hypothetical protein